MERAPRRQSMELRKRAKLNFVLMYVITSENESSFLSLILEERKVHVYFTIVEGKSLTAKKSITF